MFMPQPPEGDVGSQKWQPIAVALDFKFEKNRYEKTTPYLFHWRIRVYKKSGLVLVVYKMPQMKQKQKRDHWLYKH